MSRNEANLDGNLGKDPDVRTTANGKKFARFSLATSRKWKDKDGEQQESTEWHNIVCWGWSADVAETLRKGDRALVTGRIQNRKYEKDGQDCYITEINCFTLGTVPRTERNDSYNDVAPEPKGDIPF
jgi:single-strand DNA-binding protein